MQNELTPRELTNNELVMLDALAYYSQLSDRSYSIWEVTGISPSICVIIPRINRIPIRSVLLLKILVNYDFCN